MDQPSTRTAYLIASFLDGQVLSVGTYSESPTDITRIAHGEFEPILIQLAAATGRDYEEATRNLQRKILDDRDLQRFVSMAPPLAGIDPDIEFKARVEVRSVPPNGIVEGFSSLTSLARFRIKGRHERTVGARLDIGERENSKAFRRHAFRMLFEQALEELMEAEETSRG